jgi:hypothetical protein
LHGIGIVPSNWVSPYAVGWGADTWALNFRTGGIRHAQPGYNVETPYLGGPIAIGTWSRVAIDFDAGGIYWGGSGGWHSASPAMMFPPGPSYTIGWSVEQTATAAMQINAGDRPFLYPVPDGYNPGFGIAN